MERVGDHRAGRGERGARSSPNSSTPQRRCARALLDLHIVDGRLRRASLGGRVGDSAAILEDYATLATGLLTLHQITGDAQWLDAATGLLDTALEHFADPERPGRWFDTADDAEQLLVRPADPLDGATPSGASSIAEALLTAAHLVPAPRADRYASAAAEALSTATPVLAQAAALGRTLAGRRRGRRARPDPDRRRHRRFPTRRCSAPPASWRPEVPWWSAAR